MFAYTMTDFNVTNHFHNVHYVTEIAQLNSINGSSSPIEQIVMILSTLIASVGIVANFTVILVFMNDKKLRQKIPNIFIINQVGQILPHFINLVYESPM